MGEIYSVWFTHTAMAVLAGPAVGSYVFDATRSYLVAFVFSGAVCLVAMLLSLLPRLPIGSFPGLKKPQTPP